MDKDIEKNAFSLSTAQGTPHSEIADGAKAESLPFMGSVVKHGRIRQSLAYWCLNAPPWQWDIERICAAAVGLGCPSVELVPPELWPALRKHGLSCALAHNGMPDPVFRRGLNNPNYHEEVITRTKEAIDQAADFAVPNVIAFTGYKWRSAEDPTSEEISLADGAASCVKALSAGLLCAATERYFVPGAPQYTRNFGSDEGSSGLSGRQH